MSTWKSDMRRPKITTEVATDRKISRDISSIPVRNPIRLINLWGFFSSSQSLYNPRTLPSVAYLLQDPRGISVRQQQQALGRNKCYR